MHAHSHTPTAQLITQPPVSTAAALGTNATFSCRGTGSVLWQINGTQVRDTSQVPAFERIQVYVPLPRDGSSELIVTASRETNASLVIICVVDPGIGMGNLVRSDPVQLLVYGTLSSDCNCKLGQLWGEPQSNSDWLYYSLIIGFVLRSPLPLHVSINCVVFCSFNLRVTVQLILRQWGRCEENQEISSLTSRSSHTRVPEN